MRRLSRWVLYAPGGVTIIVPDQETKLLAQDTAVHPRLRAKIIELAMFHVSYETSKAHTLQTLAAALETAAKEGPSQDTPPQLQHERTVITMPRHSRPN